VILRHHGSSRPWHGGTSRSCHHITANCFTMYFSNVQLVPHSKKRKRDNSEPSLEDKDAVNRIMAQREAKRKREASERGQRTQAQEEHSQELSDEEHEELNPWGEESIRRYGLPGHGQAEAAELNHRYRDILPPLSDEQPALAHLSPNGTTWSVLVLFLLLILTLFLAQLDEESETSQDEQEGEARLKIQEADDDDSCQDVVGDDLCQEVEGDDLHQEVEGDDPHQEVEGDDPRQEVEGDDPRQEVKRDDLRQEVERDDLDVEDKDLHQEKDKRRVRRKVCS